VRALFFRVIGGKYQDDRPPLPQGIFVEKDFIRRDALVAPVIGRVSQCGATCRAARSQQSRSGEAKRQCRSNAGNEHGRGHS
jgi:hypothetical protein